MAGAGPVSEVPIPLNRDVFFRTLLRELAGALQDVIGLEEASGYISLVGTIIGEEIDRSYRRALRIDKLDRGQLAAVLIDLKRRLDGDFYIVEENEERIVLGNRACPFGESVRGRPALCMMTSNVFGHIAAQNLGYARVSLERTIARGDPGCTIVINLRPTDEPEPMAREYFERADDD